LSQPLLPLLRHSPTGRWRPQDELLDRRKVYKLLVEKNIPVPTHIIVERDNLPGGTAGRLASLPRDFSLLLFARLADQQTGCLGL
jgi:hypothetical protein